ncbi:hypothetical protein VPH35_079388 [Triticum aestivum]
MVARGCSSGDSPSTSLDGGAGAAAEVHGDDPRSTRHSGNASPFAAGFIFDSQSRFRQWCILGQGFAGYLHFPLAFVSTTTAVDDRRWFHLWIGPQGPHCIFLSLGVFSHVCWDTCGLSGSFDDAASVLHLYPFLDKV